MNRNAHGRDIDDIVSPLLPLFHCQCYAILLRILSEIEVSALSGLHDYWVRTSPEDAEHLPESLVRNFCGNCFHPHLISCALGKNDTLKKWVSSPNEGPTDLVAGQAGAFHIFAELCDQVEKEAKSKFRKDVINIDRTLPSVQPLGQAGTNLTACALGSGPGSRVTGSTDVSRGSGAQLAVRCPVAIPQSPVIHPPLLGGCLKVRVTKRDRYIHHCVEAASHKLEGQFRALQSVGLVFDGLRAAVNIPFHFDEYAAHIIGEEPSRSRQLAVQRFTQCPNLRSIEALRVAFQKWVDQPSLCTLMTIFLAATACKEGSFWPLGHVLLLPGLEGTNVYYVGTAKPKLLFLVNACRPHAPEVYVAAATAYSGSVPLGIVPICCQLAWSMARF